MSTPMTSQDYETSGGDYWNVGDWHGLQRTFGIESPNLLPEWHDNLAGQGRAWQIIALLFQVASLIGDSLSEDDLRSWTREEIATKFSISCSLVDKEIEAAVEHWKNRQAHDKVQASADRISEEEYDKLTNFSSTNRIPEDRVKQLLDAYNLGHIQSPTFRAEIANRIIDLRQHLSAPNTRTIAREIIRLEVQIHSQNTLLIPLQNAIEKKLAADPNMISCKKDVEDLEKRVNACDKNIRDLAETHSELMEKIGADEIDLTARKRIYVETVSYLVEQCRLFESDPKNVHMDGVFTADEIEWLTEASGKRDPQYRPDVVIRIREAMMPENLWNSKYIPTPVQKRVGAKLRKIAMHLHITDEDKSEDPPTSADDLDGPDDDDDDEILIGNSTTPTEAPPATPAATPSKFITSIHREPSSEATMGVY